MLKEHLDDIAADLDSIDTDALVDHLRNAESSDNLDDLLANLSDAKYELNVMMQEVEALIKRTKAAM